MAGYLIQNGTVIDPGNHFAGKADILVENDLIKAVGTGLPKDENTICIDAEGCFVSPGLIDHHAHIHPLGKIGIPAESVCFSSGVTTVVDAGSTGCDTFRKNIPFLDSAMLRIRAYIHVCSTGLDTLPVLEDADPAHYNESALKELFAEHGSRLLGLKLRTSHEIVKDLGYEPLKKTVELGDKLGVPVMVHCTNPPGELSELLNILRPGDTITHMYMNIGSRLADAQGHILEDAYRARERGIRFEAADARAHFSFEVSEPCIRQGFLPDFIGTDLTQFSMHFRPTAFNLMNQVAKYEYLGMSLEQVIACTTINPARDMHIDGETGSLTPGLQADIAVFRREEGEIIFGDRPYGTPGQALRTGDHRYQAVMTMKGGKVVYRSNCF